MGTGLSGLRGVPAEVPTEHTHPQPAQQDSGDAQGQEKVKGIAEDTNARLKG